MATISGQVLFDINRDLTISPGDRWVEKVPIVLQSLSTSQRITSSTNINGTFTFINVPNGSYRIVEAYGEAPGPNIADFNNSIPGPVPIGEDPSINDVVSPPVGATHLDSLTPNTLIVTINNNVTNLRFIDGPVTYIPLPNPLDKCTEIMPVELMTAADNGTMGSFAPGTETNTGAPGTTANPPYPGITPGFKYIQPNKNTQNPIGGEYTIQNVMDGLTTQGAWWRLADHTAGDETGRMMVVNGDVPGSIIFKHTIAAEPNSYYSFSAWAANLIKIQGPTRPIFKVSVLGSTGDILFTTNLQQDLPENIVNPQWKQIGTAFGSKNNTSLTVVFTSEAFEQRGNDYAIDDIQIFKLNFKEFQPVKTVDKAVVAVGNELTYTITVPNTCSNPLSNVFIKDTLQTGLEFVPGSVVINDTPNTNVNPNVGFNIPNVLGNTTATITFKAKAVSVPTTNPVQNIATMTYNYAPVAGGEYLTKSTNSAPVTTLIVSATLVGLKSVDKDIANINDTLTYKLQFTNTGTDSLVDVVIADIIPTGTTLLPNSIESPVAFTGLDLNTGIKLNDPIAPGDVVDITFKVLVGNTIPNPNPIENKATVSYLSEKDPTKPGFTIDTNTVETEIINTNLSSTNEVDKYYANIGDILTYTLKFENTGSDNIVDVVIRDLIPDGTTFVPDSIESPTLFTGADLNEGIKLDDTVVPGQIVTITFKVTVDKVQNPNTVRNQASASYLSELIPDEPKRISNTNLVETKIDNVDLSKIKLVDRKFANFNDTLTYTLELTNNGANPLTNLVITDIIPTGTTFVPNSIESPVDFTGDNPNTGITLTNPIVPGQMVTISFEVKVGDTIPSPNPTENAALISYLSSLNPDGSTFNEYTNTVTTTIGNAHLNTTKEVDRPYANIGDDLTYRINLTNNGDDTLTNVVITDPIPFGTTFVNESIVTDVKYSSTVTDTELILNLDDPIPTGITVTIGFKVKVGDVIPTTNPVENQAHIVYSSAQDPDGDKFSIDTNVVKTKIDDVSLDKAKSVDKHVANVGDTLTYTLELTNNGANSLTNVVISDPLPNGISFITTSIVTEASYRNNSTQTEFNLSLIEPIEPGESVTISFGAKVGDTIPTPNPVKNSAQISYLSSLNPDGPVFDENTNTADTIIGNAVLDSVKSVNTQYANIGDTLTYTLELTNNGSDTLVGVIITDSLPNGTTLESIDTRASYTNNSTQTELNLNLTDPIAPKEKVTITFKAKIGDIIPDTNPIENKATALYWSALNPSGPKFNSHTDIIRTLIDDINLSSKKSVDKELAKIGDILTYTLEFTNNGSSNLVNVIITDPIPFGVSFVDGSINSSVHYTGNGPNTGIILSDSIVPGQTVTISFEVVTTSEIPESKIIENKASISYSSKLDPRIYPFSNDTNLVNTVVSNAHLTGTKSVDKKYANINDTLIYTLEFKNDGNDDLIDVVISDSLPNGLKFKTGSITSSVPYTGQDLVPSPVTGLVLTNPIVKGETVTITFEAIVENKIPSSNPIKNKASALYSSSLDPSLPRFNSDTNIADTTINNATLSSIKSVDKLTADIGSILTYTIMLTNIGNTDANNVVVKDIIPAGTTFVNESIVSPKPYTGTDLNTGITLVNPIIPNESVTITFKVLVDLDILI